MSQLLYDQMLKQIDFIVEQIEKYRVCHIKQRYPNQLENVDEKLVNKILTQNYDNIEDMKSVYCLIDTAMNEVSRSFYPKVNRYHGIYIMDDSISAIIKDGNVISAGANGIAYHGNFLNKGIQIVIKISKHPLDYDFEREYYIGLMMNRLRKYIPTFVYTLGGFICGKPYISNNTSTIRSCYGEFNNSSDATLYIVYENITGKSWYNYIKNVSFRTWLFIFVQVLLSLELAQKELLFTHFDLHGSNIIIRENNNKSYSVPIGNKVYVIPNPKAIPVIIDYGFSSIYIKDRFIGDYDNPRHGMVNFIGPGFDMYKLLSASAVSMPFLRKDIEDLANNFYGKNNPYKGNSYLYANQYKKAFYSKAVSYTPGKFLDWILAQRKYRELLGGDILVQKREVYKPLNFKTVVQTYDSIFNHKAKGIERAARDVVKCIDPSSYILTKYGIMLLKGYNKSLKSAEVQNRIRELESKDINWLIEGEILSLEYVFQVKIPTIKEITFAGFCLNYTVPISSKNYKSCVKNKEVLYKFYSEMKKYVQMYYTILELKLKDFDPWVQKFEKSEQYNIYMTFYIFYQSIVRWMQGLSASRKFYTSKQWENFKAMEE